MSEAIQNQKFNGEASEEDAEFEEEELLVHVEFDCEVDQSTFNPETTFKLIGIDSENPLMQLGNKVFKGDWKDVVGTSVFFEEDEETKLKLAGADPLFNRKPTNPLKLACCTRKSLVMSRVFVKPKLNKSEATENSTLNNSENEGLSTEVEQPTITNKPVTTVENDEQMEVS